MQTTQGLDTFQARLKKIKDPKFTHRVDPETGIKIPRQLGRDEVKGTKGKVPGYMLVMAGILGAICLMFARYLRMEVINVEPYFPNGMIAELAMACMAATVIGGFMRMQKVRLIAVQAMGAAICAITMHNAVWVAPEQFAMVFSQGYVDQIMAQTNPMSIFVNGFSLNLTI